tara:strand:- start:12846 stop:14231 length:1386 start_codon:yes stop_codon:yes gene_type:complete
MKHALVALGNEESYGLLFVGGELKECGQEIRYFDAEMGDAAQQIINWGPDYAMFSPMTTFFPQAYDIATKIKSDSLNIKTVFGGHHAIAVPEIAETENVDVVVRGPVRGTIERILDGEIGVITSVPTNPDDLSMPARTEYYHDIPRMGGRYRKVMLSMLGCPFNCSYCSSASGHTKERFGADALRDYYLKRRDIGRIIEEAKLVKKYPTEEIEWVDDDLFAGVDSEEWLMEFSDAWKKNINIPMYVSATSTSILKASDKLLEKLIENVNCVGMGIQAIRPESLKLFNRQWDNEEKMKGAYDRLKSFGYNINLQCIVGLPIDDPVEDAFDTIKAMQRIGPGSIVSCYPLQIYPGTAMKQIAEEGGFKLYEDCIGDTNTGIGGIDFKDEETTKRLRNICKLATHFVKHNVDERWMRSLVDVDFNEKASKKLSMTRYHDCIVDRLGDRGEEIFNKIISGMHIRY